MSIEPVVVVHGSAASIPRPQRSLKVSGIKQAANIGYETLVENGCVLDAVEEAIKYLEDNPNFNCGLGSSLTIDGEVEMDASIMMGANMLSGAVTTVKDIAHPISLARMVMERTPHFMLSGEGATKFAKSQGVKVLPPRSLVTNYAEEQLKRFKKTGFVKEMGTVGVVAIDADGFVAAGTSSGGRVGKMTGRCSDSSIVGAGTYADNQYGAVSVTGHGESIARMCLAFSIANEMKLGESPNGATIVALNTMYLKCGKQALGGGISLSKTGEVGIDFTTDQMPWAYRRGTTIHFGVNHGEHNKEQIKPRP